jgi:hypothetical protein
MEIFNGRWRREGGKLGQIAQVGGEGRHEFAQSADPFGGVLWVRRCGEIRGSKHRSWAGTRVGGGYAGQIYTRRTTPKAVVWGGATGWLLLLRDLPVDPLAPLLPLRSRWRLAPGNLEEPAHRALKVRRRLRAFDVFGFASHGSIIYRISGSGRIFEAIPWGATLEMARGDRSRPENALMDAGSIRRMVPTPGEQMRKGGR